MINPVRLAKRRPVLIIGVSALLIFLLAIILLTNIRSKPEIQLSQPGPADQALLQPDKLINAWSSLDRDSTHIGETLKFEINILYDPARITPDLDAFERSVDVMPLEKIRFDENILAMDEGLKKYTLQYNLRAVNVELDTSYQLDPAVIYYTAAGERELNSFQIASPSIHITSYYPYDVSGIELKPVKGRVDVYSGLFHFFLGLCSLLLLGLCGLSLWHFGRLKKDSELSTAETLWLRYLDINTNSKENRDRAADSERIFTQLLEIKTSIKPAMFWSGKDPEQNFWKGVVQKARSSLRTIYKDRGPDKDDISNITGLMDETFAHVLNEDKRMALAEPSFFRRVLIQKQVMVMSTACLASGLVMLALTIWPGIWVPQNIQRYNELVDTLQTEEYQDEIAVEFSELGKQFNDARLKAASFYNAGTLIADSVQEIDENQALSEGGAFTDVAADERVIQDAEDLLEILTINVEKYRQSELQLRESVRAVSDDETIRRNLELVIKRRKAVLHLINTLLETGHIQPAELDELLNLLESQMALEFKVDEGKEAPGYYIGEDF